ncbi:MAG: hypothetical protein JWR38_4799 [Mucilaginibacter sp.]|nr:hypothetical protein [Mucilaginibacter sp.]
MKLLHQYLYITFFILLGALLLQACNSGPDYKVIRQQVIDVHDKIMGDGEKAMNNKTQLDTLNLKKTDQTTDTLIERQQIRLLSKNLATADDQMSDWMHAFKMDFKGKTDAETVSYFNAEKLKVERLDSLYKSAISESDAYLKRFKGKPAAIASK